MASDASMDVLRNIRSHAEKVRKLQQEAMDVDEQGSRAVEARLSSTIEELQKRLERRQTELDRLRASAKKSIPTTPSADPRLRLQQLQIIQAAYERMTPENPELPSPGSALPAILAARVIQSTIKESKDTIASIQYRIESGERQLTREENQLSDAKLLSDALKDRTSRLEKNQYEDLAKSSSEKSKELVKAKQRRRQAFQKDAEKLRKVLDSFIEEHLSAMLAAEEIGGPVVGELMDVDEDMLTAGFSAQGKPKSSKATTDASDAKRQRRIDDIWGSAEGNHGSEKDASAEEVRLLLDELIESGSYVTLERDSAVARFLVRAKVAQFYPKDARRLKLVDFSRELDA